MSLQEAVERAREEKARAEEMGKGARKYYRDAKSRTLGARTMFRAAKEKLQELKDIEYNGKVYAKACAQRVKQADLELQRALILVEAGR